MRFSSTPQTRWGSPCRWTDTQLYRHKQYLNITHMSVSLGQREDASRAHRGKQSTKRTEQDIHHQLGPLPAGGPVTGRPARREPRRIGHPEPQQDPASPSSELLHAGVDESDGSLNGASWTLGEVRTERRPPPVDPEEGYQADFTGEVLGLSSDSSPHFSEWEAMEPVVECDDTFMIFSASGRGLLHLLVDRKEATPVSIFQLPADCGYSVRTSWSDLEMMVPYDGCYVTQENGSYVLPMQWLSTPLKLSCPVKMSTAAPMVSLISPLVFCSSFGMAVQIHWQERDQPALGVIMNGAWGPFVSDLCAFKVDSQPQELTFLISQRAPCITADDGLRLQLTLDDEEYVLSCPVGPDFLYSPSQFPSIPDSIIPVSSSSLPPTSQTRIQEQSAQLPNNQQLYYLYAGLPNHQLPLDYASGPQSANAHYPTVDGTPGSQQQLQYPYFDKQVFHPHSFLLQGHISHQMSPVSVGQHPYPFVFYHPDLPFYHLTSNPTEKGLKPQIPHPDPNPQIHYHPATAAVPATQAPAVFHPLPSQPKQPMLSKPQTDAFYPQASYYSHRSVSHSVAARVTSSPHSPTASSSDFVRHPSGQLYAHSPFHLHTHPSPAGENPQKPVAPQRLCASGDSSCSYYSYPYSPHHPFYLQQPYAASSLYPQTPSENPSTPPAQNPLQTPHLQCLKGRMFVFLPYADPRSIHILEHQRTWKLLSDMPSHCGFVLQQISDHGVLLHSPLPACHSYFRTPTIISLPVRFWDGSVGQNRTMDLECPYQKPAESPAPVSSLSVPVSHQPTKDKGSPSGFGKSEVFCSSQQMNVALPAGIISEMIVKDFKGNLINLNDQKDCGYYLNKGKDGKNHLIYPLHAHCHQSVQGEMHVINVIYMTENGLKEAQFSCPVVIPRSGQECNLHSEYRLPCGSGSITQTQCLSMGCCFNKHPLECYYPMEECTIDRRMVFSVPASITDPPLSPALLVSANNSTCKPQKVTSEYALFNIPMDGCGMRRMMVGKTLVYMLEITNMIQAVTLNYGTITRDSPIRLFVECRYSPGTVLSVSYVVKTPSFGPEVHTQGVFGVQLRISKDAQYTSYHPQYHQPLSVLLGKPLHLEVRLLNSPDPSLVLLVHFCVAYPRSGKAVWVLLYNGCPNPLDPSPPKTVLSDPKPPTPQSQTRRFTISTFQFLPNDDHKDMDEEIYFMCSTEICSPHEGPCVEGCFGQ